MLLLVAGFASRRVLLEEWHLTRLASTDEETRKKAAEALGECGSVRSILPLMEATSVSLTRLLQEKGMPDVLVGMDKNFAGFLKQREKLARQIRAVWPDLSKRSDESQMTFLNNQLASIDARVEREATQVATLLWINPYAELLTKITEKARRKAVPCLSEQLGNDKWHIRWQAATLLGVLGPHAEDSVPILKTKLHDSNSFVCYAVAEALKTIGYDDGR